MKNKSKNYEVIIIGGGVSGTALLYVLSNYTNLKSILLLEKHEDFSQVSSHFTQNSQTLHFGDIETNYNFEKAKSVSKKAELVKNYVENIGKNDKSHIKKHKMVIGVGEEANFIRKRYKEFKKIFTKIRLLEREEIAKYEPKVIEGRDTKQDIAALFSPDGYIMNYYNLSKSFIKHINKKGKKIDIKLEVEVDNAEKYEDGYKINTSIGIFNSRFLVSDAGAMSIKFAKQLGYGKHLGILSLGGDFYKGPETLNGKVYTWQDPKLPHAAIHGDADFRGSGYTRFGPTAKVLLMLERRDYSTVDDYFRTFNYSFDGWLSFFKVGFDPTYFSYIVENYLIEIPVIGKIILSKYVKKIVPTIKWWQIKKDKGYGGARPQIIDTRTKKVNFGEARIEGENAIFNITPSPGASTCLANAETDTKKITERLGYKFDQKKFDRTLRYKTL